MSQIDTQTEGNTMSQIVVSAVLTERVESPAAWYGRDLQDDVSWIEQLSDHEVAELRAAVSDVESRGLTMLEMRRSDFDLPTLSPRLQALGRELDRGRGFWLLRGLPVDVMTKQEAATCLLGHRASSRHTGLAERPRTSPHLDDLDPLGVEMGLHWYVRVPGRQGSVGT